MVNRFAVKDLLKPLFRCRFSYKCPYYRVEAFTCNTFDAEHGYCGKFRQFSASDKVQNILHCFHRKTTP